MHYACNSSNTISICKRIRPGSNLATRVKVGLEQFYYCGSIGDTPGSPKGRRHRKMAAPVPFMTRRSAFFAFFIAKSRALRPLRAHAWPDLPQIGHSRGDPSRVFMVGSESALIVFSSGMTGPMATSALRPTRRECCGARRDCGTSALLASTSASIESERCTTSAWMRAIGRGGTQRTRYPPKVA